MMQQFVKPAGANDPRREASRIRARTAAWLAWSAWVLTVALVAITWLLNFLTPHVPLGGAQTFLGALVMTLSLAYPTVGALVASRRPENPIGWIFCAAGLALGFQALASGYADYTLSTWPYSLPGAQYMAWLASWITLPVVTLATVLLLLLFPSGRLPSGMLFPEGRLPTRSWRVVVWMATVGSAMVAFWAATRPGPLEAWTLNFWRHHYTVDNPLGIRGAVGVVVGKAGLYLLLVSLLFAAVSLISRLVLARGEERQQLKWFVFAATMLIAGFPATMIGGLPVAILLVDLPIWDIGLFVGILGFLFLPIVVGVAILRYHLYDIDLIINRTLVYGTLSACVVGLYVLVVAGAGALFQVSGNLLVSLLATGLVALLFHPLRIRLQRGVNRLMYGERDDPYAVLSRLGRRLEGTLAPEEALSTIVETVTQALKLPYAAITLRQNGKFVTAAEHGSPVGEPVILPLVYHTEEVGQLVVTPRTPGEAFASADRRLLDDLAHQAGAAAHAARLTADLRRSRERLVTAREEERRRLRRDLHDGLGPTLGALTIGLDTARSMVTEKPAAEELLARLKEESQEAVADVRRLVYGLRPPALDDLGLVAAIRQQAAKHGQVATGDPPRLEGANRKGGMVFTIEAAEDLPPLPAAVEVATYRIAQEAITNAARHAEARSCRVCLSLDEAARTLELRIIDYGVGMPGDHRAGVGMSSMRERAEELGGTLRVERLQEGGTCVLARLPLPAEEE